MNPSKKVRFGADVFQEFENDPHLPPNIEDTREPPSTAVWMCRNPLNLTSRFLEHYPLINPPHRILHSMPTSDNMSVVHTQQRITTTTTRLEPSQRYKPLHFTAHCQPSEESWKFAKTMLESPLHTTTVTLFHLEPPTYSKHSVQDQHVPYNLHRQDSSTSSIRSGVSNMCHASDSPAPVSVQLSVDADAHQAIVSLPGLTSLLQSCQGKPLSKVLVPHAATRAHPRTNKRVRNSINYNSGQPVHQNSGRSSKKLGDTLHQRCEADALTLNDSLSFLDADAAHISSSISTHTTTSPISLTSHSHAAPEPVNSRASLTLYTHGSSSLPRAPNKRNRDSAGLDQQEYPYDRCLCSSSDDSSDEDGLFDGDDVFEEDDGCEDDGGSDGGGDSHGSSGRQSDAESSVFSQLSEDTDEASACVGLDIASQWTNSESSKRREKGFQVGFSQVSTGSDASRFSLLNTQRVPERLVVHPAWLTRPKPSLAVLRADPLQNVYVQLFSAHLPAITEIKEISISNRLHYLGLLLRTRAVRLVEVAGKVISVGSYQNKQSYVIGDVAGRVTCHAWLTSGQYQNTAYSNGYSGNGTNQYTGLTASNSRSPAETLLFSGDSGISGIGCISGTRQLITSFSQATHANVANYPLHCVSTSGQSVVWPQGSLVRIRGALRRYRDRWEISIHHMGEITEKQLEMHNMRVLMLCTSEYVNRYDGNDDAKEEKEDPIVVEDLADASRSGKSDEMSTCCETEDTAARTKCCDVDIAADQNNLTITTISKPPPSYVPWPAHQAVLRYSRRKHSFLQYLVDLPTNIGSIFANHSSALSRDQTAPTSEASVTPVVSRETLIPILRTILEEKASFIPLLAMLLCERHTLAQARSSMSHTDPSTLSSGNVADASHEADPNTSSCVLRLPVVVEGVDAHAALHSAWRRAKRRAVLQDNKARAHASAAEHHSKSELQGKDGKWDGRGLPFPSLYFQRSELALATGVDCSAPTTAGGSIANLGDSNFNEDIGRGASRGWSAISFGLCSLGCETCGVCQTCRHCGSEHTSSQNISSSPLASELSADEQRSTNDRQSPAKWIVPHAIWQPAALPIVQMATMDAKPATDTNFHTGSQSRFAVLNTLLQPITSTLNASPGSQIPKLSAPSHQTDTLLSSDASSSHAVIGSPAVGASHTPSSLSSSSHAPLVSAHSYEFSLRAMQQDALLCGLAALYVSLAALASSVEKQERVLAAWEQYVAEEREKSATNRESSVDGAMRDTDEVDEIQNSSVVPIAGRQVQSNSPPPTLTLPSRHLAVLVTLIHTKTQDMCLSCFLRALDRLSSTAATQVVRTNHYKSAREPTAWYLPSDVASNVTLNINDQDIFSKLVIKACIPGVATNTMPHPSPLISGNASNNGLRLSMSVVNLIQNAIETMKTVGVVTTMKKDNFDGKITVFSRLSTNSARDSTNTSRLNSADTQTTTNAVDPRRHRQRTPALYHSISACVVLDRIRRCIMSRNMPRTRSIVIPSSLSFSGAYDTPTPVIPKLLSSPHSLSFTPQSLPTVTDAVGHIAQYILICLRDKYDTLLQYPPTNAHARAHSMADYANQVHSVMSCTSRFMNQWDRAALNLNINSPQQQRPSIPIHSNMRSTFFSLPLHSILSSSQSPSPSISSSSSFLTPSTSLTASLASTNTVNTVMRKPSRLARKIAMLKEAQHRLQEEYHGEQRSKWSERDQMDALGNGGVLGNDFEQESMDILAPESASSDRYGFEKSVDSETVFGVFPALLWYNVEKVSSLFTRADALTRDMDSETDEEVSHSIITNFTVPASHVTAKSVGNTWSSSSFDVLTIDDMARKYSSACAVIERDNLSTATTSVASLAKGREADGLSTHRQASPNSNDAPPNNLTEIAKYMRFSLPSWTKHRIHTLNTCLQNIPHDLHHTLHSHPSSTRMTDDTSFTDAPDSLQKSTVGGHLFSSLPFSLPSPPTIAELDSASMPACSKDCPIMYFPHLDPLCHASEAEIYSYVLDTHGYVDMFVLLQSLERLVMSGLVLRMNDRYIFNPISDFFGSS